jgi:polyamine oxidase
MRRRDALGVALMAVAARLASAGGVPRARRRPLARRVVVIGAGMSGLAAARELRRAGCEVAVLEGRNRLGGRTWTDHRMGLPMDMGAHWIEGTSGNPLTALARELGVRTVPTPGDEALLFDHDGRRLSERQAEELEEEFDALIEELGEIEDDGHLSVGAAIERSLEGEELSPLQQRALDYGRSWYENETAADLGEMSLAGADEGDGFGGGAAILPDGYGELARRLARDLDVHLSQPVSEVNWEGREVRVVTRTGATFAADRVVITLPLGVLKAGGLRFRPALPPETAEAIDRLGMGVLDKAILTFARASWPEADTFGYLSQSAGEWPEWYNLGKYLGGRPILLTFCAGRVARRMEAAPEADVRDRLVAIVRTMFGSRTPEPTQVVLTRWAADPFSRGSYSFLPVGARPQDRKALARPLGERLHFAGEATSVSYFATVHGAYLSGLRAAREIAG